MYIVLYVLVCLLVFSYKYDEFKNFNREKNTVPVGDECYYVWKEPKLITPTTLFFFPVILLLQCIHIFNCKR